MQFDYPIFLLGVFPASCLLITLTPIRFRNIVIVVLSYGLYFWIEPIFSIVVLLSAVIDWLIGSEISNSRTYRDKNYLKFLVFASVLQNISILIYYKYVYFIAINANEVLSYFLNWRFPLIDIALPIGVSFVIFEKITYVVDIYNNKCLPANKIGNYLTYIFLFPKLLAGPIVKYHEISGQLISRMYRASDVRDGFIRFLFGVSKKSLLADNAGGIANAVFSLPVEQLGFESCWLGALSFSAQIYLDFSAYSDMAIGLALMLGFRLRENFNYPYTALNITEFWRRWHISLSSWIREYVYIPLGGNRHGVARSYANLTIAFLLSGIWHGAEWTFVVWGLYHGAFLIIDRAVGDHIARTLPALMQKLLTFIIVTVGWVIFRSSDLGYAFSYMTVMVSPNISGGAVYWRYDQLFATGVCYLLILLPFIPAYAPQARIIAERPWFPTAMLALVVPLTMLAIGKISASGYTPFLYFRF